MSHFHRGNPAFVVSGAFFLPLLASLLFSCGGGNTASNPPPPPAPLVPLSAADVQLVVQNAAASLNGGMVIAVADRAGTILAVFQNTGAPPTSTGNFGAVVDSQELAVALARTAAFFSNDQAPLSSRTVRFISSVHFPPGVALTSNGPLYGIENSNRGCTLSTNYVAGQQVPAARSVSGTQP